MARPAKKPDAWPADTVERVPVTELIPYARNARTHSDEQVAQIASSIREWGFTTPILRDEDGTVLAGHGRLLAAFRLKLDTVPVITARGWSLAKKQAYVIADNKIALNAGWDYELLSSELSALQGDYDLGLVGFTDQEIADLLSAAEGDEAVAPEEFPEADESLETEHRCPSCGYEWSGKPS